MKSQKIISAIFFLTPIVVSILYLVFFRSLVEKSYYDQAPGWFSEMVEAVYPRFEVEKERFELSFFQNKADQIVIRFGLVSLFLALLAFKNTQSRLFSYYSRPLSKRHFNALYYIFYLGLLAYTWDWYQDFPQLTRMSDFYQGVHIFRWIGLDILNLKTFYVLFAAYLLSLLLVLLKIKNVLFSGLLALLLVLFQGYFFSFEKIQHSYTTLTYASLIMPFLIFEKKVQATSVSLSFGLFLIQLCIASAYFLAGLEKILVSGFNWASAETFRTYIQLHQQPWGMAVADSEFLSHVLPWCGLLLQLGFISILFSKKASYAILPLGILFHWGTRLLMGIGSFFSTWIFVYIFFLNWDKIVLKLSSKLSSVRKSKNGR